MEQQLVSETKSIAPKTRKHRKLKVFLLIAIITSGLYIFVGPGQSYIASNTPDAKWIETNGQKYLEITADTYYELGLLEGKYLSAQIFNLKLILMLMGLQYWTQGL